MRVAVEVSPTLSFNSMKLSLATFLWRLINTITIKRRKITKKVLSMKTEMQIHYLTYLL